MARQKQEQEPTINATVRMPPQDWEALNTKAKTLGLTRTQFLKQIARGEIQSGKVVLSEIEKEVLGESFAS